MSHNVVASIDCDKAGFPCGNHLKVKLGSNVAETRALARERGWAVNVSVTVRGLRTKHDYCPEHKGSL